MFISAAKLKLFLDICKHFAIFLHLSIEIVIECCASKEGDKRYFYSL